jgi:hypothetical protein
MVPTSSGINDILNEAAFKWLLISFEAYTHLILDGQFLIFFDVTSNSTNRFFRLIFYVNLPTIYISIGLDRNESYTWLYPVSLTNIIASELTLGVGLSIETIGYKKSAVIPTPRTIYGIPAPT